MTYTTTITGRKGWRWTVTLSLPDDHHGYQLAGVEFWSTSGASVSFEPRELQPEFTNWLTLQAITAYEHQEEELQAILS